ncbi:MAG: DEAD/DEAH box helicase [Clostridia bacterium]|nr:DEAD/DEAH box helicase [Clostridia bacterium]
MNSLIKVVPNVKKYNDYLFDVKKGTNPMMISGLTDTGKVHIAYSTRFYAEKPIVIITYNELQAKKIVKDLNFFGEKVDFFPKRDTVSFDYIAESKDLLFDRISVLNNIISGKAKIIVTTIEAVIQKMISKESLYKNSITLKPGDTFNLDEFKQKLVNLGFERYDLIEGKGQFSIRGGIVDIATSKNKGVRIEFWGDEIDSIRNFDITSQRTVEMLEEVKIFPSFEFVLDDDLSTICERIVEKTYAKNLSEKVEKHIEEIKNGDFINKIDKYFNCFYKNSNTLLDYLQDDYIIFLDEIEKLKARSENIAKDNENLKKDLIEKNKIVPEMLTTIDDYYLFLEKIEKRQTIYLERQDIGFVDKYSMHAKRNGYSFSYREVNFFRSSMDILFQELQEAVNKNKLTVILGGNNDDCKKMSKLLFDKGINNKYKEKLENIELTPGEIIITNGAFSSGFEILDMNLLVISTSEIFEIKSKRFRSSKIFKEGEKVVFSDIKEGDYVVHKYHGIGKYLGVQTIRADGITKDYIKIKYKGDDVLYVPTNSLDNIRKYIGSDQREPIINSLQSKDWKKTKEKVKKNLREVAEELIQLYSKRQKMQGFSFSKDTLWQKEFENSFPYVETDDQLRCIEEVKKDMETSRPMDRLLCGDVGYGKTEVAIRAAFKACMDQKQVVYLAPTTILSNQQYEEFQNRMKEYPIKIELLNRFRTKNKQTEIIKKLELGEIDIVIRNS